MSVQRQYPISCPRCGRAFEAALFDSVTLTPAGEERAALLENRVNLLRCDACGSEFRVDKPLLVHDPSARRVVYWLPGETVEGAERQALETLTAYAGATDPKELPEMRVVLERNELIDKIFAMESGLDDRLLEYLKLVVAVRNPAKIRPEDHDILFNGRDSNDEALSFVVQNRTTREIEMVFQYGRDACDELAALFAEPGESRVTLRSLFPGPYVSYRRLTGRDDLAELPLPTPS